MKRALFFTVMLACRHHDASHEKDDDSKKEGAHAAVTEDKRTAAEEAIHAYETAGSCDAKAQTIMYGKSHRDQLGTCAPRSKIERYETKECDSLAAAMTQCHAIARRDGDKTRYWLVKQPNGQFLVDWIATERPVQLADLVNRMPSTPSVARVRLRPNDTYKPPFRGKQKTHAAYRVRAPSGDRDAWGFAFAPRESPEAATLASILTMRDFSDVTVAISFPSHDPEVMVIEKVFATDFFESDAERTFATPDGGP